MKMKSIKHPKMAQSHGFKSKYRDGGMVEEAERSGLLGTQRKIDRQLQDEKAPNRKPSSVEDSPTEAADVRTPEQKKRAAEAAKAYGYAKGGPVMQPRDSGVPLMERNDERDLQRSAATGNPGAQPKPGYDKIQTQNTSSMPDHTRPHTNNIYMAEGGSVEAEREIEEAASLAAAIMMRRRKMAEGGEIHSHDSIYSDDSTQVDLSRNADEDANEEDQLSFNALRKENYSETAGLEQLDQPMGSNGKGHEEEDEHDRSITGSIRRKMKNKSPITK